MSNTEVPRQNSVFRNITALTYVKGSIAFEIPLVITEVQLPWTSGGGRHPQASSQSELQGTGKVL